jgi:hypothetical protein
MSPFMIWAAGHCTASVRRSELPYGGMVGLENWRGGYRMGFLRRRQKVYCGLIPGHAGPHSWETL